MNVVYKEHYRQKNHTDDVEDYYRLYIASVIRKNMINQEFVEFMLDVFTPNGFSCEDLDIADDEIIRYIQHCVDEFIMDNRGLPDEYFDKEVLKLISAEVSIKDDTLRVTMSF